MANDEHRRSKKHSAPPAHPDAVAAALTKVEALVQARRSAELELLKSVGVHPGSMPIQVLFDGSELLTGRSLRERPKQPTEVLAACALQAFLDVLPLDRLADMNDEQRAALEVVLFAINAVRGGPTARKMKAALAAICGGKENTATEARNLEGLAIIQRCIDKKIDGRTCIDALAVRLALPALRALTDAQVDTAFHRPRAGAKGIWAALLLDAGIETKQRGESDSDARTRVAGNIRRATNAKRTLKTQ